MIHQFFVGHAVGNVRTHRAEIVRDTVVGALSTVGVDGATFTAATGLWAGTTEPTTAVTVVGLTDETAHVVARNVAAMLHQTSVMVVTVPCTVAFVEAN